LFKDESHTSNYTDMHGLWWASGDRLVIPNADAFGRFVMCEMHDSPWQEHVGVKLLSVNMSKTQVVIFNDFRHSHTDSFVYGCQALRIVDHYTYLGVVLHKSGCCKAAIEKLAAAGKRALFAMQYRCSELGLNDTHLLCSLFSSLVQPVLSYSCEVWCLERSSLFSQMNTVHNHFMKRTLHVRKSVPDGVYVN